MSAESNLLYACREWRRLAEAEGQSMASRNWQMVAACQLELACLQPRITSLLQSTRAEWSRTGAAAADKEKHLQSVFAGLIRLEECNAATLDRLRLATAEKVRQLELAGHNLQRIQRSYANPTPSAWTSFS